MNSKAANTARRSAAGSRSTWPWPPTCPTRSTVPIGATASTTIRSTSRSTAGRSVSRTSITGAAVRRAQLPDSGGADGRQRAGDRDAARHPRRRRGRAAVRLPDYEIEEAERKKPGTIVPRLLYVCNPRQRITRYAGRALTVRRRLAAEFRSGWSTVPLVWTSTISGSVVILPSAEHP